MKSQHHTADHKTSHTSTRPATRPQAHEPSREAAGHITRAADDQRGVHHDTTEHRRPPQQGQDSRADGREKGSRATQSGQADRAVQKSGRTPERQEERSKRADVGAADEQEGEDEEGSESIRRDWRNVGASQGHGKAHEKRRTG